MIYEDGKPTDFLYLQVNPAFTSLTGLVGVEGKLVSEVVPGIQDTDPGLLEIYGKVADSGIPARFETFVDALGIWFDVPVYSPKQGEFIAQFDNITERKRSIQTVKEAETQFQAIFQGISDSVVFTNTERKLVMVNRAFERLFCYDRQDVIGKTTEFLYANQLEYQRPVPVRIPEKFDTHS